MENKQHIKRYHLKPNRILHIGLGVIIGKSIEKKDSNLINLFVLRTWTTIYSTIMARGLIKSWVSFSGSTSIWKESSGVLALLLGISGTKLTRFLISFILFLTRDFVKNIFFKMANKVFWVSLGNNKRNLFIKIIAKKRKSII